MKNFLSGFCLLLLAQGAQAQFMANSVAIGGTGNLDRVDHTDSHITVYSNTFGLTLQPSVGFYFTEASEVGLGALFTTGKTTSYTGTAVTHTDFKTYGFNPFLRHDAKVTDLFGFYGQISPYWNYSGAESTLGTSSTSTETKTWNYGILGGPGAYYSPWQWISLEAGFTLFNYRSQIIHVKTSSDAPLDHNTNLGFDLSARTLTFSLFLHL